MSNRTGLQVKNRAPAPIQITAEQILLEARDRASQSVPPPPKRHIADLQELQEYRLQHRKEFEDRLRHSIHNIAIWLRYAKWEENQNEIDRARSIYERIIENHYTNPTIWIRYAEMEMRHKFINRARNVWDRAITLLPRVETFWYKYTFMEELLGNIAGCRLLFERWMNWEPNEQAWLTYIKFEQRQNNIDRTRGLYERYIAAIPNQVTYLRYAKWEDRNNHQKSLCRRIYERAIAELDDTEKNGYLYINFAKFEERCNEEARARAIYKFALGINTLSREDHDLINKEYINFEKTHGDRAIVDDIILTKRRTTYEEAVKSNQWNYDAWLDYTRMEESVATSSFDQSKNTEDNTNTTDNTNDNTNTSSSRTHSSGLFATPTPNLTNAERIRDVYERAIAAVPPIQEKRYWVRYIYLWINYAIYEEAVARDNDRARAVYRAILKLIPHKLFTFGKIWLLAAKFEIRNKDVLAARKLLGQCLGICNPPKEKVIKGYIELELSLGEIDRVRTLYEKYITLMPTNVQAWIKFAELERSLGEDERVQGIYELGLSQPAIDMPEILWKSYIDSQIEIGNFDMARELYNRLLNRTSHVKVWLSYATFEATVVEDMDRARHVYNRAYTELKNATASPPVPEDAGLREHRALIVEAWYTFETTIYNTLIEERQYRDQQHTEEELNSEERLQNRLQQYSEEELMMAIHTAQTHMQTVEKKRPTKVRKWRNLYGNLSNPETIRYTPLHSQEESVSKEEYWDYIFPDDEYKPPQLKLMELAKKWKMGGGATSATAVIQNDIEHTQHTVNAVNATSNIDTNEINLDDEENQSILPSNHPLTSSTTTLVSSNIASDSNEIDLDNLDEDTTTTTTTNVTSLLSSAIQQAIKRPREHDEHEDTNHQHNHHHIVSPRDPGKLQAIDNEVDEDNRFVYTGVTGDE